MFFSGENVEEAFLDTAKKIYQNIQDGRFVDVFVASELLNRDVLQDALYCTKFV